MDLLSIHAYTDRRTLPPTTRGVSKARSRIAIIAVVRFHQVGAARRERCDRKEGEPEPAWGKYGASDRISEFGGVDLYWLPLGAGGHSVQVERSRAFEAVAARLAAAVVLCDLYHSALVLRLPQGRFVIEQAPIRGRATVQGAGRGRRGARSVARWAGRVADLPLRGAPLARRVRFPTSADAVDSPLSC